MESKNLMKLGPWNIRTLLGPLGKPRTMMEIMVKKDRNNQLKYIN